MIKAAIKAALIAWLRFLPLDQEPPPAWDGLLVALGILTILYAILIARMQTNPKVVAVYSSIGKMGLMTTVLGGPSGATPRARPCGRSGPVGRPSWADDRGPAPWRGHSPEDQHALGPGVA